MTTGGPTDGAAPVDLCVVVPAHDDAHTVTDAIRSALACDGVREVVVVDDGSTDDTAAVAGSLGDPRVRVLRRDNGGPGAARNTGAAAATASHLVFLDADDVLLPDAGRQFTDGGSSGALLIRSGVITQFPDGTERTTLARPSPFASPRGTQLTGTFAIARSLYDEIGGYDPELGFGENSELLLRANAALAARGATAVFTGAPTLRYVKTAVGAERQAAYRDRKLAAAQRLLDKHGDTLRADPEALGDHLAVMTTNLLAAGRRREALRAAAWAVRVTPRRAVAWGRLVRCLLPTAALDAVAGVRRRVNG